MHTVVIWQKETKITYKRFSNILLSYEHADQIGKEEGYGETIIMRDQAPFKVQLLTVVSDFVSGVRYKFPVCCVLNFCIDNLLGRPSAQLRWTDKTDHIPCFVHSKKHTKKAIPLNLY